MLVNREELTRCGIDRQSLQPEREDGSMSVIRQVTSVLRGVITFLVLMLLGSVADAQECRDFGTEPFCAGSCPAGWHEEGFASYECVTGRKVRCCKDCGPAQYGTEGCPYPSFGGSTSSPRPVKRLGKRRGTSQPACPRGLTGPNCDQVIVK